jgi:hypothetical protein
MPPTADFEIGATFYFSRLSGNVSSPFHGNVIPKIPALFASNKTRALGASHETHHDRYPDQGSGGEYSG